MATDQPFYNTEFPSLHENETVAQATERMLHARVADLPVIDDAGRLTGLFRLARLFEHLLPRAALIGEGLDDLTFMGESAGPLRERMQAIRDRPVREFLDPPDHPVRPDTPAVEIILMLYRGQNNVPVVSGDGRLIGMVSAREVLAALQN